MSQRFHPLSYTFCTTCGQKLELIHRVFSYDPYTGVPNRADIKVCPNVCCPDNNHKGGRR